MIRTFFTIILLAFSIQAISQTKGNSDLLDGTFSIGKNEGSLSLHYVKLWTLTKKQKLSVGVGARLTSYVGANKYYITAPAKITSGDSGPLVIFKENIIENIDTFLIKSPWVTAINLSINLGYQVSNKWAVGFNIDAIGFSLGSQRRGNYINGFTGSVTQGKPTGFNALLVSDNDLGTLNSELFARYSITDKISVKAGATFLFTEYTSDSKVQKFPQENDRFRNKSLMLGMGISYKIK